MTRKNRLYVNEEMKKFSSFYGICKENARAIQSDDYHLPACGLKSRYSTHSDCL